MVDRQRQRKRMTNGDMDRKRQSGRDIERDEFKSGQI